MVTALSSCLNLCWQVWPLMGICGDSSVILLETVVETLSSWWKPYENVVILWKLRWNSVETGRTRLSVFLSWHKNVVIPLETEKTLSSRWQLEKALFIPFIKIRVKQRCYPDWNWIYNSAILETETVPGDTFFVVVTSSNQIQHSRSGSLQASRWKVPNNSDAIWWVAA